MLKKIFEYLFFRIYEVTFRTNKSIPEWSTIILISVMLSINIITVSLFLDIPIFRIGEKGFVAMPLFFVVIGYYYYLRNNRYKILLKEYRNKTIPAYYRFFVLIYELLSFCLFFISLNFDLIETSVGIGVILIIKVVAHSFYKSPSSPR